MAKPQYNTEKLIENIKRRCSVPTSQLTFTNAGFADIATDEMQTVVVPLIMSTREEFFVEYVDVVNTASGIIPFPSEAVGTKLRSVCSVVNSSPLTLKNIPRIDLDVVAGVQSMQGEGGFYVQGNNLCIYPQNAFPGKTIRLFYFKRTLALADPTQYGQIKTIDVPSNTITVTNLPTTWKVGTVLNAVSSTPNFLITNPEITITNISSPTIILDSVVGLEVGDYVSEQGFSAIPMIPVEAHAYLSQLSAVKVLEALGDQAGMQLAQAKADKLEQNLLIVITGRVDGSPRKIVDPSGGLRSNSKYGRRF